MCKTRSRLFQRRCFCSYEYGEIVEIRNIGLRFLHNSDRERRVVVVVFVEVNRNDTISSRCPTRGTLSITSLAVCTPTGGGVCGICTNTRRHDSNNTRKSYLNDVRTYYLVYTSAIRTAARRCTSRVRGY